MKKIACVGYHATGSGVIDDLFREFDNVAQGYYEAESRFLQDPDGISDLEFHLVENPNRLVMGTAIERFLRYAKDKRRMYEKIFGSDWMMLCQRYVDSITKFQFLGYHYSQLKTKKPYVGYLHLFYRIMNKLTMEKYKKPVWYDYFPKETEYHACISESDFLEETRNFVDNLADKIPSNANTEYVLFDQLVAGDNPSRYLRYVRDLKVIVVDRDPRDLYIHHEIHGDHALPKHDPYKFCVYYRDIRKRQCETAPNEVLYVSFEDMILNYDIMVKKVMGFVGINSIHHIAPKTHFIPEKSIQGTQLWKRYPQYIDAVKIIEQELPDYLYNYTR